MSDNNKFTLADLQRLFAEQGIGGTEAAGDLLPPGHPLRRPSRSAEIKVRRVLEDKFTDSTKETP